MKLFCPNCGVWVSRPARRIYNYYHDRCGRTILEMPGGTVDLKEQQNKDIESLKKGLVLNGKNSDSKNS